MKDYTKLENFFFKSYNKTQSLPEILSQTIPCVLQNIHRNRVHTSLATRVFKEGQEDAEVMPTTLQARNEDCASSC